MEAVAQPPSRLRSPSWTRSDSWRKNPTFSPSPSCRSRRHGAYSESEGFRPAVAARGFRQPAAQYRDVSRKRKADSQARTERERGSLGLRSRQRKVFHDQPDELRCRKDIQATSMESTWRSFPPGPHPTRGRPPGLDLPYDEGQPGRRNRGRTSCTLDKSEREFAAGEPSSSGPSSESGSALNVGPFLTGKDA